MLFGRRLRREGEGDSVSAMGREIQDFAGMLRGKLLQEGDGGYDEARRVWNAMINRRPGLIARCAGTQDVVHSVRFAREHGLLVSVRGGGHSVAGNAVCDGGLMIDLSPMKGIRTDPDRRVAWAEAGLRLSEFDRDTQAHGLATTLGIASDTGIAGLTLGGGYGWLNGRFGLACDNVTSAEVVTANGRVLTASATENADLFWGIRGGGGNFGVVTRFEYRLHPMDHVLSGMVMYPWGQAREALQMFHRFSITAPDAVTTIGTIVKAPDGNSTIAISVCYSGPVEEGEKLLEPLRSFGPPIADTIKPMRYVEMQRASDEHFPPGGHYYWKTSLLRDLSDGAIHVFLKYGQELPTAQSVIFLQQLHGAASRIGPTETAFPHRYHNYDCGPLFGWEDPADSERCIRLARDCWTALRPFYSRSVYLNALGEEGDPRIREAFGPNYAGVVALKNKYDPTNLFRLNPNIKPTV